MTEQTKTNQPPTSKPPHPKELSPEYHKAHKQLMLWAAILFIWEFVGIDLEKAKDTEGYAGAMVKSIKSPQAVPWVLLLLVAYFLIKCYFEWAQCNADRREMRYARADFISGLVLGLGAVALYFGQALSRVQLADTIQSRRDLMVTVASGLAGGLLVGFALYQIRTVIGFRRLRKRPLGKDLPNLVFNGVAIALAFSLPVPPHLLGLPFSLRVFLLSLGVSALATWMVRAYRESWRRLSIRWIKVKREAGPNVGELNQAAPP